MMKRIAFFVLTLLLATCGLKAQNVASSGPEVVNDAVELFIKMPVSNLNMLSSSTRSDMIDFLTEADSIYQATNALGETAQLTKVSADRSYLQVRLTPMSIMSIKQFTLNGESSPIYAVAHTVGDSVVAPDTKLFFMDAKLNELPASRFMPKLATASFFNFPNKRVEREVLGKLRYPMIEYKLHENEPVIEARFTAGMGLNLDDQKIISTYMKPNLLFMWNGRKFVEKK